MSRSAPARATTSSIDKGLSPGEVVVIEGVDKLQQGHAKSRPAWPAPSQEQRSGSAMSPSRSVHPAAGRDVPADGGHPARGRRGLSPAAGLGVAAGGLPDDPGADVLSRRQPGRDGVVHHGAARAAVRPGARLEADDLDQFRRQLGHHAAIRAGAQHRRGRAGSAGRHQRRPRPSCRATCPTRRSTARSTPPTRRS